MTQTAEAKAGTPPGGSWLVRRFRRRTSSLEFIPVIDGLRFVAISMVLLLHVLSGVWARDPSRVEATGFDIDWVAPGQFGVQLFFVISGLILAIPFSRRSKGGPEVSLRRYYLRRLTRLEPPYLLALTGFMVLNPILGHGSSAELAPHYVSGVFYAHGFAYQSLNPLSEVTWSLEVEVQFYLVLPLLATVFRLKDAAMRRRVLACAVVAATGIAHALTIDSLLDEAGAPIPLAFLSLSGHLNLFLIGMLVADLFVHDWVERKPSVGADLAFLGGLTVLFLTDPSFGASRTLLLPAGCALVVGGAIRGRFVRRLLERPAVFLIGGMCYSIYLLHFGVIRLIGDSVTTGIAPASAGLDLLLSVVVLTLACLLVAVAYFVLVERPFMRLDWPGRALDRIPRAITNVPALLGSRRYARLPVPSLQLAPTPALVSVDEPLRRTRR